MILAGVVLGFFIQRWTAPRTGLKTEETRDLSFWMIVTGLLGSRLFYVLFHWPKYRSRPLYEFVDYFGGGLMFQGGLLVSVLAAFFILRVKRMSFLKVADALSLSLSLGQACGRVGCFLTGCCYGKRTPEAFPLGVIYPSGGHAPSGVSLYPVELFESLGLMCLTVFLWRVLKKQPYVKGKVFGFYLLISGLLRFSLDFLRGDDRGTALWGLPPTTFISLGIIISGFLLLQYSRVQHLRE
jgi:phosphatidylglycerol:prolipoprotein diacylglycerol transferase